MLDLIGKAGSDESFFTLVSGLAHCLNVSFQKFHLLDEVGMLLIILAVAVDVGKEAPVIEVIDSILENGIGGTVAPKSATEPAGEGLHQLVSGVVGGCI